MRKWWLWAIGGVLVLATALVAGLILIPPAPPYEFLSGQRPVDVSIPKAQLASMQKMGLDYTFYSFRGDFAAVKAKAKAELTKKGFEDAFKTFPSASAANDMAYFTKGDMMSAVAASTTGTAKPSKMPDIAMVMIYKDTRITPKAFKAHYMPGKEIGWVSVAVMGRRERTPFDTFREWIGL
jgi:hypothetical protein